MNQITESNDDNTVDYQEEVLVLCLRSLLFVVWVVEARAEKVNRFVSHEKVRKASIYGRMIYVLR